MRVCIFTDNIDKTGGGPARSVPALSVGLAKVGIDVTMISLRSNDMNTHLLTDSSVNFIHIENEIPSKELEALLIGKYDIIHAQGIWCPIYHRVVKIAARNRIPFVMTPRGALEPWCMNYKWLKKRVAFKLYQKSDLQKASCILTTSNRERMNVQKLGIQAPIAMIPNGVNLEQYPCRAKDTISNIKKQVLYLSRIHFQKGLDLLVDAWKDSLLSTKEWSLLIVGNGEQEYINKLNNRIKEYGLADSVTIAPPVFNEEKVGLYHESAVLILPTFSENFGMVVAEALSCGLPVITTTGAPWEDLVKYKCGWWIDLSVEELAKTLKEMASTPRDVLFEMGQRGAIMVRSQYDSHAVSKRIKEMYEWILNPTLNNEDIVSV